MAIELNFANIAIGILIPIVALILIFSGYFMGKQSEKINNRKITRSPRSQ